MRIIIVSMLLLISSPIIAQSFYEELGDYSVELTAEKDKFFERGEYSCTISIYDSSKRLVCEYGNYDYQIYEMKKFILNKTSTEEVIFILFSTYGASLVYGKLLCVHLKSININSNVVTVPIISSLSHTSLLLSEDPKLSDMIKDIDNDGIMEILETRIINFVEFVPMTARGVSIYYHFENGQFIIANDRLKNELDDELNNEISEAKEIKFRCNEKDDFNRASYLNLLSSIVIEYALVNDIDTGIEIFRNLYKCDDADLIEKKILHFYLEDINAGKIY